MSHNLLIWKIMTSHSNDMSQVKEHQNVTQPITLFNTNKKVNCLFITDVNGNGME
jgi:hypothetical protein